ncbi:hypothetical protein [Janibacter sp. GXQ6167]|uniref:hypothetical protein n=1 Tax=Janibacter sp. GXQ6167 TaxID=3240791 RepID=UPI00352416C7
MSSLPGPDLTTVVRANTPRGEIALRERVISDGTDGGEQVAHELIVAGVFAMDSRDTSTEVALAELCLAEVEAPERVLIGGLGLGFTAWSVLKDRRVRHLDVVELEEDLIAWARLGLTPTLGMIARHPRAHLHAADIAAVLGGSSPQAGAAFSPAQPAGAIPPSSAPTGPWDLVLLDVDNGPGFLVHETNAGLYRTEALRSALAHVRPGGALAIWAAQREPDILDRLRSLARTEEILLPVTREGRDLTYAIYLTHP